MLNLSSFNRILKFELCHYVNISQAEPSNISRAGAAPSRTSALKQSRVRAAAGAAGEPRGTRACWVQSRSATRGAHPVALCARCSRSNFPSSYPKSWEPEIILFSPQRSVLNPASLLRSPTKQRNDDAPSYGWESTPPCRVTETIILNKSRANLLINPSLDHFHNPLLPNHNAWTLLVLLHPVAPCDWVGPKS
jgi:hypothetical protein